MFEGIFGTKYRYSLVRLRPSFRDTGHTEKIGVLLQGPHDVMMYVGKKPEAFEALSEIGKSVIGDLPASFRRLSGIAARQGRKDVLEFIAEETIGNVFLDPPKSERDKRSTVAMGLQLFFTHVLEIDAVVAQRDSSAIPPKREEIVYDTFDTSTQPEIARA